MKMDDIVSFAHGRFADNRWLDGNCYYFATILKARFSNLRIVYLPIPGHFMAIDPETHLLYDWASVRRESDVGPFYYWDELESEEPGLFKRITQDCIY